MLFSINTLNVMKLLFKNKKFVIVMKKEDVKTLFVIIRYVVTFIGGLLTGNSDIAQSLLN